MAISLPSRVRRLTTPMPRRQPLVEKRRAREAKMLKVVRKAAVVKSSDLT